MSDNSDLKWYERKDFDVKDYALFVSKIIQFCGKHKFAIESLGTTDGYALSLISQKKKNPGPDLLIAGGFHGEESGGPWGIIRFMEVVSPNILTQCNLSFLPCVTVTGFIKQKRQNYLGDTANGGFIHQEREHETRSVEGEILEKHIKRLSKLGKDGFLTMHEDSEENAFYVYTYERTGKPGMFSKGLRDTGGKFFGIMEDKKMESPGGGECKDGVIFGHCDGTFEDYMYHLGTPFVACTETSQKYGWDKRIDANCALLTYFVEFFIKKQGRELNLPPVR